MTAPLVSVCVPVYNAQAFVASTLDSVLAQTLSDWELIVVDDASTDGSWPIVQRYGADPRVRVKRHPVNRGAATTWNEVLGMAAGRYVKLLCSDDLIVPYCLAHQVAALEAHPSAVLVAARRDIIDDRGKRLMRGRGLGRVRGLVPGLEARRALVRAGRNLFGEPSVVMFRRDDLMAVDGFDHRWRYTIDMATYSNVLERGDLVAIEETLASFRVSSTQWSAVLEHDQRAEHVRFLSELADATGIGRGDWRARIGRARASSLSAGRSVLYRLMRRRGD
jgi:glycosyltransferase involved in cell wall biosynthesis